jgi:Mycothiol maleylpyruvate isomerase N-terminal domain
VATRQEIVDTVRGFIQRADKIAAGLSPADWEKTTYEQGWTVKQVYCHLASMGGAIPYFVNWAKNPQPAGGGGGAAFDVDAFNAMQVAQRQGRSTEEILTELRTGFENSLKFLDSVSDELLALEIDYPFVGGRGPLADLLVETVTSHNGEHLDDIERAARG